MVCIYCGGPTHVTNSREQKRIGHVWRRRSCKTCQAVFTTIESADLSASLRVSHPGIRQLEVFNRDKLFMSLARALGHRSDFLEAADALTATIIDRLLKTHSGASIEGTLVREHAYTVLSHFDNAAATSYAAYHTRR